MKKKMGKEGIRTKAIVWDISGFMVPCANKFWVFWLLVVFWFWFWLWFFLILISEKTVSVILEKA